MSIDVFAVTQLCCQPDLQISTQQCGVLFAKSNVAVHCCWATAHLYGEQMSTGVFAVTQACREPGLQSST